MPPNDAIVIEPAVLFVYAPGDLHPARIVEMLSETRAALLVRSPYTGLDYAQEAEHDPGGAPGTWHRAPPAD